MVASVGALKKNKPNRVVAVRVLVEGTNGILVNTRTRIRDQERAVVASDFIEGLLSSGVQSTRKTKVFTERTLVLRRSLFSRLWCLGVWLFVLRGVVRWVGTSVEIPSNHASV